MSGIWTRLWPGACSPSGWRGQDVIKTPRANSNLPFRFLATASRVTDLDDAIDSAARHQRLVLVIESYVALLARTGASEAVSESFRLSDVIRGRSVQNALAASSARAVAGDPALAELARKVQDLDRQIAAELGAFNHALALPPRVAIQPASRRCRLTSTSSKLRAMWPSATSQIVFQPMRA